MAAVIVDNEGRHTSDTFGITEFCSMIHSVKAGEDRCFATWRNDCEGIYICHMGFCDFSVPITLPNGHLLGRVLAGQALSTQQDDSTILKKTLELGIPKEQAKDVLSRVHRKTPREMGAAYKLLKQTLHFFVEKSYSVWEANNRLKAAPARQDRILSQITQIMYSYNLTIDLQTDAYTLITGTGMDRTVEEYKKHSYQRELKSFHDRVIHPAYLHRFNALLDFESTRRDSAENGFRGSLEYPVLYPGDDVYEWHEINVFIETEEDGRRVANILGRDITESHNAQERSEKELRAAAAKNQILSELTKMLYSYNLTLNLRTGKYSMIIGNGMTQFMEIFKSTDDYETAYHRKIAYLDPANVAQFAGLASLQALRARSNANGFIGNLEYGAITDYGEEWHEINVFISTNEAGDPIAIILGSDITEAHKRQEQRENQQRAAMARYQLLSGVTKMLYSYNLTVNLETWKYSLITGTGMDEVLQTMHCTDDYFILCARLFRDVASEDKESLEGLIGIRALRNKVGVSGYVGTVSCRMVLQEQNQWHEANLFMGTNEDGVPVANILGRDVTESHQQLEAKERELPSNRRGYAVYQTLIEDTGIGMTEDFLPHIFEEFTRERSSTESRVNGTGLGMPIVKKLVHLMQGTITVESQIGRGTRFTVTLPHRIAEKSDADLTAEQAKEYKTDCFTGKRILLAEDNELNAEIAITILEEAGFTVERAEDGIICVDMLEKAAPGYYDLILMDIQMPNMDGYKATQTIRKFSDPEKADITIIAMTANAFEEDRQNAFRVGMNGHIAKPIRVEKLLSLLANILKK